MASDSDMTIPYRGFGILLMFMIAFPGFFMNVYLFYKFLTRRGKKMSGFQKLCIVKTVPNIIVCATFLFWAVPLSLMPDIVIDRFPNVVIGRVAAAGAYLLGPLIQICMSINRFYVIYFPLSPFICHVFNCTNLCVTLCIITSMIYTTLGFPEECGYFYDHVSLFWIPEPYPCAYFQLESFTYIIIFLSLISNSFNVMTIGKLLMKRAIGIGISQANASSRRKKRVLLFVQSAIQDWLHVIDLINATYIYTLSDDLWFQFIFLTCSFVSIFTFDGFVMFYFHPEVHPKFIQPKTSRGQLKKPEAMFTTVSVH